MNKFLIGVAAVALLATSVANAQPNDHDRGDRGQHQDNGQHPGWGADRGGNQHWQRGQQMGYNDWNGAQAVDYRQHHLRAPPRGYEWRQSNGQYILAAVATGVIASIILSNGR
jgi:Ni/Co efflux regulator RcnB